MKEEKNRELSRPEPAVEPSGTNRFLGFWLKIERFAVDILGICLLALAFMTLLSFMLPDNAAGLLKAWSNGLRLWFGWGILWIILSLGLIGIWLLRRRTPENVSHQGWRRLLWMEGIAFGSLALISALGGLDLERAEAGLDGGRVGWGLATLLSVILGQIGLSGTIWVTLLLAGIILFSLGIILKINGRRVEDWEQSHQLEFYEDQRIKGIGPVVSEAPLGEPGQTAGPDKKSRKKTPLLPPQFRKHLVSEKASTGTSEPLTRSDRLPPLELLVNEQTSRPDERNINMTAGLIEKSLSEFGIPAKVVGYRVGPTVTQFAVEPGYLEKEKSNGENEQARQKVRVAQISALERDLALALAAERLRIEAPVPGRPYVGIEVPNSRSMIVRLRPVLEQESFYRMNSPLAIALGRDVSGQPVVADLAKMPHLLIAGTTGSGKSVCIAALTTCLAINNTPTDLRLVMIDPKMVELVRFNGLPHLFGKVETDINRILTVLRWTMSEMDRRYKLLEGSHSRNLESYNRKARRRKGEELLPHIVVMIDELADLMMSAPDQTEHMLVRLAQMARATGIHLVIATQRPSTDVVTGLIKANFPARVSFSMASSIDSRVILDTTGAESLLGHGDMLFLPPEAPSPIRVQGVMVSDQEVERVITFWQKSAGTEDIPQTPPWEEMFVSDQELADRDDLVEKAVELVRQERRASASMLQRRLRIGYPRAARLIDELEELGVIGPAVSGGRERDVLIDPEDLEEG